jgi:hypothetical protein
VGAPSFDYAWKEIVLAIDLIQLRQQPEIGTIARQSFEKEDSFWLAA